MKKDYNIDTLCVQAGWAPKTGESRIPPIVQSTTFFYGDSQAMADLFDLKRDGFFYTRLANPTVDVLEKKVAALEGGACGIGCASGMSALLLTAMTLCEAGDNIVTACEIYGGTFNLFSTTLPKFGIEARFLTRTPLRKRSKNSSTKRRNLFLPKRSPIPPSLYSISIRSRRSAKSTAYSLLWTTRL